VLLVRTGFPLRRTSAVGLGLLVLAGLGAIGIGFTPENVNWPVHELLSLVTFVGANLGLVVLSLAMFRDTRWSGYRAYTLFSGLIGLVATLLLVRGIYAGLGAGGMERLVVAPVLLWLVVVSAHLLRIPQFAPRALPT